jgi:hypothetical protein
MMNSFIPNSLSLSSASVKISQKFLSQEQFDSSINLSEDQQLAVLHPVTQTRASVRKYHAASTGTQMRFIKRIFERACAWMNIPQPLRPALTQDNSSDKLMAGYFAKNHTLCLFPDKLVHLKSTDSLLSIIAHELHHAGCKLKHKGLSSHQIALVLDKYIGEKMRQGEELLIPTLSPVTDIWGHTSLNLNVFEVPSFNSKMKKELYYLFTQEMATSVSVVRLYNSLAVYINVGRNKDDFHKQLQDNVPQTKSPEEFEELTTKLKNIIQEHPDYSQQFSGDNDQPLKMVLNYFMAKLMSYGVSHNMMVPDHDSFLTTLATRGVVSETSVSLDKDLAESLGQSFEAMFALELPGMDIQYIGSPEEVDTRNAGGRFETEELKQQLKRPTLSKEHRHLLEKRLLQLDILERNANIAGMVYKLKCQLRDNPSSLELSTKLERLTRRAYESFYKLYWLSLPEKGKNTSTALDRIATVADRHIVKKQR